MANDIPILYVFVRTDMPSMTPGKSQAHSGHAANAFVYKHIIQRIKNNQIVSDKALAWMNATNQGFGTQINLKGNWNDVIEAHCAARDNGYITEMVLDPTYPYIVDSEILGLIDPKLHSVEPVQLADGRFACHREAYTAIYFFGTKEELEKYLGKFPLHP